MTPPTLATTGSATQEDANYQHHILQGVSRTFALTIPQLPQALANAVGNAYLLCRIADTIEDEMALSALQKREFAEQFMAVVEGGLSAEKFSAQLSPLLTGSTIPAEQDLVRNTDRVIRITHSLSRPQRAALERCVAIMGEGMAWFQTNQTKDGLPDLAHLDAYCYYVAGVVGEMLTDLFCHHSPAIAANRQRMMMLAPSFGQGLQMTNILKDIWEDRRRGACWLPQQLFLEHGFNLADLDAQQHNPAFEAGLNKLIAIAHGHLRNALTYTILIPAEEKGLRRFCLWAIGMALLTLRKIHRNAAFKSGQSVKISRRSVTATIALSNLFVSNNRALGWLFDLVAQRLPKPVFTAPSSATLFQRDIQNLMQQSGAISRGTTNANLAPHH